MFDKNLKALKKFRSRGFTSSSTTSIFICDASTKADDKFLKKMNNPYFG